MRNDQNLIIQGQVLEIIKKHTQANPIHTRELCAAVGIGEVELRGIINLLRQQYEPICSGSGYWYARHSSEVAQTRREMTGRANAMNRATAGLGVAFKRMERKEDKSKLASGLVTGNLFEGIEIDECLDVVK